MVMIEDLVNANQSFQAWNTIDERFNVTNPNLMRSMIIDRITILDTIKVPRKSEVLV